VTAALVAIALAAPLTAHAQGQPWQAPQQPAQPQTPPFGTQPQASPYGSNMQAGGLTPPAPMQPNATPPGGGATEDSLNRAKTEDSGRGLEWVWLNVEGGYEHVGLKTFNVDRDAFAAGFVDTTANGAMVGAGVGLRLIFLTLGARGRVGFFKDYNLFTLGGEAGIHIPLGAFDPHLDLGFGYAGLGSLQGALTGATDAIKIRGFYGRIGGGLDFYPTSVISLGANASVEALGLTRPALSPAEVNAIKDNPLATSPQKANADLLAVDGTSYGLAVAITAVAGLHF
jgi:hypothetical protein